jgi:hypothetical protein
VKDKTWEKIERRQTRTDRKQKSSKKGWEAGEHKKQKRKRAIKIVEGGKEGTKKPRLYRQRGK